MICNDATDKIASDKISFLFKLKRILKIIYRFYYILLEILNL